VFHAGVSPSVRSRRRLGLVWEAAA
jgi:hypothetical protein